MQDESGGQKRPEQRIGAGARPAAAIDPSAYQGAERESILRTAPTLELPKGGGAMQGIGETFQVNPATGTASLSIPLSLTPGRGGFQPELQLSYDSGAGNGPFGLGWDVGIASISRSTNKRLPTYRDGGPNGSEDLFALTGAEELVPKRISGSLDTATDGTWDILRYRPRTEGGFAIIERWTKISDPTDVHWRTIDRSNVVRLFGQTGSARVVDPEDSSRIFQWLLERVEDELGNRIKYTYRAEDRANPPALIPEKHRDGRCTWVYPDVVYYGNETPSTDDFRLAVVFDYGGRSTTAPELDTSSAGTWSTRQDPYSTFKAGFDRRCYRLCHRIIVFHDFPDEATLRPHAAPVPSSFWVPVRSTELVYNPSPALTTLKSVTHRGWAWNSTTSAYDTHPLPAVEFTYTNATVESKVRLVNGVDDLPFGVDPRTMQWVDLDGEGLTGLMCESGGGWFYKRNEGSAALAPWRRLPSRPNLGLAGNQLQDIDRDGRLELVSLGVPAGSYARSTDDDWEHFRPFRSRPNIDWGDPNLRQLDLDGDGLADVLISEGHVFTWYRSKGRDGWAEGGRCWVGHDDEKGPVLVFGNDSESIFLADMSGDGSTDLVRVRNGNVCYWPNLGYGRFGHKITLAGSPRFDRPDQFDPRRIRLADIDGSGPADVLYLGSRSVRYWFNQAGNSFSAEQVVPSFPGFADPITVSVTDLLGTGTACLVWSSPLLTHGNQPLRYVDLMSDGKPHLLKTMDNHRGREVRFTYAASTKFYLADRRAGTPWATRLPFPVQVVEKVESVDHITGWKLAKTHAYHHGFYDGVEREFRGFGMVETWDAESVSDFEDVGQASEDIDELVPPVRTRTWFHTGAWKQQGTLTGAYATEYWAGDPDLSDPSVLSEPTIPTGLSPRAQREATRALRGQALRVEVYSDDGSTVEGVPYSVTETTWEVREIQAPTDVEYGVYHVVPGPSRAAHYERVDDDPRVAMTYPLDIDDFGTVLLSAAMSFPRRSATTGPQSEAHIVVTDAEVVNDEPITLTDAYHLAVPTRTTTWELNGHSLSTDDTSPPTASAIRTAYSGATAKKFDETGTGTWIRELSIVELDYWNDTTSLALTHGTIGSRALVYQTYQKVYTAAMITAMPGSPSSTDLEDAGYVQRTTGEWWARSGTQTLDATKFWQATAFADPWGGSVEVDWDSYRLHITDVRQQLGGTAELTTSAVIDYRVMAPNKLTDVNDNFTEAAFDEVGRVVEIAVASKGTTNLGDELGDATQEFSYSDTNWDTNERPNYAHAKQRNAHGGTATWLETRSYSDGGGNVVQAMALVEDGDVPQRVSGVLTVPISWVSSTNRWVGSGRTVVDNKGNVIKQYEPFFTETADYVIEKELVEWGVSPLLRYDPVGRNIRTEFPDTTYTRVEIGAWETSTYDANDTASEGLGTDWYNDRKALAVGHPDRRAAESVEPHEGTPHKVVFDALGRMVESVAHNGFISSVAQLYTTAVELDVQGNVLTVTDAIDVATQTQTFDMLGRALQVVSADAGTTDVFLDSAGQPLHVWKSGALETRHAYDVLRRPVTNEAKDGAAASWVVHELFIYGDELQHTDDAAQVSANNLKGRVFRTYDGAGELEVAYDFKGNVVKEVRTFADDATATLDWVLTAWTTIAGIDTQVSADLSSTYTFTTERAYDAVNRVTKLTTPRSQSTTGKTNEVRYVFDKGGRLKSIDADLREDTTTPVDFVDGITYDALGRRETIDYSNGTTTTYTYDATTKRLANIETRKPGTPTQVFQDIDYTYDAVGNIVQIDDGALDTEYFANQQIDPTQKFTYDALYRLTAAEGREKTGMGQPLWNHYPTPDGGFKTPGATNTLLQRTTRTYSYDEVGNILTLSTGSGGWTRTYTYEEVAGVQVSNKLVSYTIPGAGGPATITYNDRGAMDSMHHTGAIVRDWRDQIRKITISTDDGYNAYDATGKRVRKTEKSGLEETFYLGDWELYVKDVGGTSAEEHETLQVMDDRSRVALVETCTEHPTLPSLPHVVQRYQLDNHLGTALVELDESAGVISYEEYHPYGTTAWWAEDTAVTARRKRYRYTGKERDAWTGMADHGARFYLCWLGRWESADPAGMVDGPNRYAYVRGNPVAGRDPSGEGTQGTIDPEDQPAPEGEIEIRTTLQNPENQTINAARQIAVRPGTGKKPEILDSKVDFSHPNDRSVGLILVRTGGGPPAGTGSTMNVPGLGPAVVLDAFVGKPPKSDQEIGYVILGVELGPNPLGPNSLFGNQVPEGFEGELGVVRSQGPVNSLEIVSANTQQGRWTNATGGKTVGSAGAFQVVEYSNTAPLGDTISSKILGVGGETSISNTGLRFGGGTAAVGGGVAGSAQRLPNWVGGIFPRRAQNEVLANFGLGVGIGFDVRLHWADTDQDTVREYGFGVDFEIVSFDVAIELGRPAIPVVPNAGPGGWNPGLPR